MALFNKIAFAEGTHHIITSETRGLDILRQHPEWWDNVIVHYDWIHGKGKPVYEFSFTIFDARRLKRKSADVNTEEV